MLFKHLEKNSLNEQKNQDVYFDHKLIKLMEEKDFWNNVDFWNNIDIIEHFIQDLITALSNIIKL